MNITSRALILSLLLSSPWAWACERCVTAACDVPSAATEDIMICSAKPFDLALDPGPAHQKSSQPIAVEVLVGRIAPGRSVAFSWTGSGSASNASGDGFLTVGEDASASGRFTFAVNGGGVGVVTVVARLLQEDGSVEATRRADLHVSSEEDGVWLSGSSPTDLAINRIKTRHASRKKNDADLQAELASIVTAQGVTESTYRPSRAKDATGYTVSGRILWTDRNGNTHGLPSARVEIHDAEYLGDLRVGSELIIHTTTDPQGNYTVSFSHDDGEFQGTSDLFVRVLARSDVADIKPMGADAQTYQLDSAVVDNAPAGNHTFNVTAGNVNDNETVYSVHHALVMIGSYGGYLAGTVPAQIVVRFPTTRSTSCFVPSQRELHILRLDRWDWDVIHHEYGHYFMNVHGIEDNPGGNHGFSDNLSQRYGDKSTGIRLAWGEAWPTYFGTVGQQVMSAAALGVPDAGDLFYTDTEDSTLNYSLELETGKGEDNEISVCGALWDLYDTASDGLDSYSMSDKTMFATLKSAAAKHVGAAWEALAASLDNARRVEVGGVFAQSNIAPLPEAPADHFTPTASRPAFKWKKNGGGTPNPLNEFVLRFYSPDLTTLIFEKNVGDVAEYTPTEEEWATILGGGGQVKWLVAGKNTTAPATPGGTLGYYWSPARSIGSPGIAFVIDDTGSMSEEIGGVRAALSAYIDAMEARIGTKTPRTIQLITFKDNVSVVITSSDLSAVRSAVAGLSANGGGDCPEAGAQALQVAARNLASGATVLFATDASSQPGVDVGAMIALMQSKGITVNTILSGDCDGEIKPGGQGSDLGYSDNHDYAGRRSGVDKPGEDDDVPPSIPLDENGQPPFDDHGDSSSSATPMMVDVQVGGMLGVNDDTQDYFVVELTGGVSYTFGVSPDGGSAYPSGQVIDTNGVDTVVNFSYYSAATFMPTVSGRYFIRVYDDYPSAPYAYKLSVSATDAFSAAYDSSVDLFSAISKLTGGAMLVRDGVNDYDTAPYVAAALNVMLSTLGPTVIDCTPGDAPRGVTMNLTLSGARSNWRQDKSEVSFPGSGIRVLDTLVISPTEIVVLSEVDESAINGFYGVEVITDLGRDIVEVASGSNIVRIVDTPTTPMVLSVSPANVVAGSTNTIQIRGFNTSWSTNTVLDLGAGITVESMDVAASGNLEARIVVDPAAALGFRQLVITTGAEVVSLYRAVFVGLEGGIIPTLIDISPDEGETGETLEVDITGSGTAFAEGISTVDMRDGIEVLSVEVVDEENLIATIRIASDARLGFRDVTVDTGGQLATMLNGFLVTLQETIPVSGGTGSYGESWKSNVKKFAGFGYDYAYKGGFSIKGKFPFAADGFLFDDLGPETVVRIAAGEFEREFALNDPEVVFKPGATKGSATYTETGFNDKDKPVKLLTISLKWNTKQILVNVKCVNSPILDENILADEYIDELSDIGENYSETLKNVPRAGLVEFQLNEKLNTQDALISGKISNKIVVKDDEDFEVMSIKLKGKTTSP